LEVKLTGILNTYALAPGEDAAPYGTEVYPGVNAHNHQHLFCLRIDPNIDGPMNTIFEVDAVASDAPVGSKENLYGNAFYARKKKIETMGEAACDYNGATSRTWDLANTNKLNPYSKKPVAYKLVSREVPSLLPKENSLVWKRAGFARHAVHVVSRPMNTERGVELTLLRRLVTPMIRCTRRESMFPRHLASHHRVSPRGSKQIPKAASITRTSFCGTHSD
jgi:Cu2+-containing amine oxidase